MEFKKEYFDIGGSVYFYDRVDALPKEKENALVIHLAMVCRSWTFGRMTDQEREDCINSFLWARDRGFIKGNFDARWKTMTAMYSSFLAALGYDRDPMGWRSDRQEEAS